MIGEPFRFRLQPKHIMAAIDACEAAGYDTSSMALGTAVRMGIMVAFETLLKNGAIKECNSFDYARRIQGFKNVTRYARSVTAAGLDASIVSAEIQDLSPILAINTQTQIKEAVENKIADMRFKDEIQKGIDSVELVTPTAAEIEEMNRRKVGRAKARELLYQLNHKMKDMTELTAEETQLLVDYTNIHIVNTPDANVEK